MPTTWVQSTATDIIPINYNRCAATGSVPPSSWSSFRCFYHCPRVIRCSMTMLVAAIRCWHFFQPIWFVHTKWYIDVWTWHRFSLSHVIAIDVVVVIIDYLYYCRCCLHSGPMPVHHIFTLNFNFSFVRLCIIFSTWFEVEFMRRGVFSVRFSQRNSIEKLD